MDRSGLLKRVDRAWEALKASYAGLSGAELTEPGVTGDWSVKDIIAHVTWWEAEALTHLPLILAGGRPPRYSVTYGGIDAFNAQMAEQRSKLSLSEVLRQRDDTHRRLINFLQSVPEDQIARETRFRRRLRLDTYSHYPKHAEAIRDWRERRSAGKGGAGPMNDTDFSSLSRPIQPMPQFVLDALEEHGLLAAYKSRPPYQQNDYLGWINRAKRPETKQKRLHQMLDELARGDVYMKMDYQPPDSRNDA